MSDSLFDDVKELLDKEKGDERILKQILRACENNEVISNYERNYVKKLSEKHLGRHSIDEPKSSVGEPSAPDVVLSKPASVQKSRDFEKNSQIKKSDSKNSKMMLGIGGIALAIIIIIAIGTTGMSDITKNTDVTKPITNTSPLFSIDTDSNSYQQKDIISISGTSNKAGTVNISIENHEGVLVWSEQLNKE